MFANTLIFSLTPRTRTQLVYFHLEVLLLVLRVHWPELALLCFPRRSRLREVSRLTNLDEGEIQFGSYHFHFIRPASRSPAKCTVTHARVADGA